MKKFLAIAATLAASSAFAGVKLEVRSDYVNTPNYDTNTGSEVSGSSLFTPSVARLYLNGNVGDAVVESAWNLRSFTPQATQNPYTGDNDLAKNMTVDTFVEHLWAGKTMGEWTFKAGKLEVNTGGFERQKTLHGDTYLTSMANSGAGGAIAIVSGTNIFPTPTGGYVTNPENSSGVSAEYAITPEHKMEVQVTNQVNSTTGEDYNVNTAPTPSGFATKSLDRRHTMGLNYLGSFMDKMLVLNLNYTSAAGDTNAAGHEIELIGASLRVAPMADLTIDLEYFGNKDKVSSGATSYDLQTTSTIIEARYNMNGWTPVVKYEMSENKDADKKAIGDFKRDAWAVGVEYAPKADEAFRYHVAYTSIKDKDFSTTLSSGQEDVTKNMIVVGFKYTGDMAK